MVLPQPEAFPTASLSLMNQGEARHTAGAQSMFSEQVDEVKQIIPYLRKKKKINVLVKSQAVCLMEECAEAQPSFSP